MGKPFSLELEGLEGTYDWSNSAPIDNLTEFAERSADTPLYVVGSGGSLTAAAFASLLHLHTGMIARCVTPLEFLEFGAIGRDCSVLLVTAGGNNRDILSAFDGAVKAKPRNLGVLCASDNNRLTKRAEGRRDVLVHAMPTPAGGDGFLATNSLVATLVWLLRAYIAAHSLPYAVPKFSELADGTAGVLDGETPCGLDGVVPRETLVVLYDAWGKTAAVDAESKLVEAGLSNVQLADFRNFAHGRHNWLDKNRGKTALVALVHPGCELLAQKTLELIPAYTPTASLATRFAGPVASLALLVQVMHLVKLVGANRGIDPGRPGVADFGERLYNLPVQKGAAAGPAGREKSA